jgi:hypothetical protein|tara:strand:+ start:92 stop:262 length:171 start_codon:yes stop_codon:yes gene_type:complete
MDNYNNLKEMFEVNLKILEYAKESEKETQEVVINSIIIGLLNFTKELENNIIIGET